MAKMEFDQIINSSGKYRAIIRIGLLVAIAAAIMGGLTAINIKYSLLALAFFLFILIIKNFDVHAFIYLLALTWWLPMDVGRLIPLQRYLGPWFQNITLPEILAYTGLILSILRSRQIADRIFSEPVWIFLVILTVGGILAASNIQTDAGIVMFRRSTFFFAAVILLCRGLLTDRKIIDQVTTLLIISGVVFCGSILFVQLGEKSLFMGAGHYEGSLRVGGFYQIPFLGIFYFGPNNIGLITAVLATISLAKILVNSFRGNRILMSGVFIFFTVTLILTGSRASIASMLISAMIIVFYLLFLKNRGRVVVYAVVFIVAFSILIPLIASPQIMQRLQFVVATGNDPYGSIQTRLRLLDQGLQLLNHNPLGIGYGTFVTLQRNSILWEQNLFLNTVLGSGILGLIGLVGFYLLLFSRARYKLLPVIGNAALYLLVGFMTFFVNSLFTDPNAETAVYFCWLILGIVFAAVSIQPQSSASIQTSEIPQN